jgi:hypothetical protein
VGSSTLMEKRMKNGKGPKSKFTKAMEVTRSDQEIGCDDQLLIVTNYQGESL